MELPAGWYYKAKKEGFYQIQDYLGKYKIILAKAILSNGWILSITDTETSTDLIQCEFEDEKEGFNRIMEFIEKHKT